MKCFLAAKAYIPQPPVNFSKASQPTCNMLKLLLICEYESTEYNHAQAFLLEFDELLQLRFQVLGAI